MFNLEQFRTLCLNEYKLDPVYFCTTPGLAFEACLKMARVELELLTDIDMILLFEKGIRGKNKKVIGKFKDELGGKILTEFVALRAKTYACVQLNDDRLEEHQKAKGTNKCVIKKHLSFNLYKTCTQMMYSTKIITLFTHKQYTQLH